MPRGQASSSRSYGTQPIVARPSLQSRKLILETYFAVKKDFSKFEATSWAVQELKSRGLKWLFKPVTSTAYERLVWSFYENLKYDCNRPDILTSSIDERDVGVTVANIAATFKCSAEQPEADDQWIARPPMLTEMLPPSQDCLHNFGLWTMCYRRMCAPWDTKHRDGTYSSQPYIHFTEAIGAPFLRSSGCSCINFGMGCTIELRTSPKAGDYHSHSSSCICSGRRGS
jgi:hypothetical protein